ncbi:protein regulator of cytokinesis 1 [Caerostris extrusa]|uniref:Protein regulator of cytokinesis 1 n=1 Tax=Caerostris extrusa TaxID=172846 RepID=A0AAV4W2P7_CAEEX|nr:protein regulator of cytokinesis 1 [Caerostris extrusa]
MDLKNQSQSGETSLEEIENEGIKNVKISLQKLYTIWNDFGIDINQKSNRAKVVWVHVQNLIQDILKEETDFYKKVLKRVENYKIKIQELSTTLSVLPKEITAESLIEEDELLQQELDNLYQLKNKQIKAYQDLKNVELKYCHILNFPEHQLSSAKRELISIWESTEYTPETPFEREILSTGQNFSLSDETFQKIEKTINEAEIKKAELEEQKKTLMKKLTVLWERLQVEGEKTEFLKKHQACNASTIKSIQQEIERYEKIKKENIERFIISLQQELHQLWNKCHVAESIRQQFKYYFCSERTDEVLQTYEAEVEKWRNYYEDVEHIFKKINKRDELWSLMLDFEKKAADPNRFKNRKGNLLQEEKQRKKLQKDLPALETNIFKDIEAYEVAKQCPFLYDGEDYRIFVTNQWTERTNQKENYKQEKYKQHLFELGLNPGMSGKLSPSVAQNA